MKINQELIIETSNTKINENVRQDHFEIFLKRYDIIEIFRFKELFALLLEFENIWMINCETNHRNK